MPAVTQLDRAEHAAVGRWRELAVEKDVGMTDAEMDEFSPAFDHEDLAKAKELSA